LSAEAIRTRRRLTNKLIAQKNAAKLGAFFDRAAKVIVGDGDLILGAAQVVEAFAAQFRDPAFVTYERTCEDVQLDDAGERAAEFGQWVALGQDGPTAAGRYSAVWKQLRGQWVIEAELYVTLEHHNR